MFIKDIRTKCEGADETLTTALQRLNAVSPESRARQKEDALKRCTTTIQGCRKEIIKMIQLMSEDEEKRNRLKSAWQRANKDESVQSEPDVRAEWEEKVNACDTIREFYTDEQIGELIQGCTQAMRTALVLLKAIELDPGAFVSDEDDIFEKCLDEGLKEDSNE